MSTLAVVGDLLSDLPPRAGIALCLVAEADRHPHHGSMFRQLVARKRQATEFPMIQLQEWVWAGIVHVGLGLVGQRERLLVWMEPGGLGDVCLGYHRHHSLAPVTTPVQFPGINLSQAARIAAGKHPVTGYQIRPGLRCESCKFVNTKPCREKHPNPMWPACTRHKEEGR